MLVPEGLSGGSSVAGNSVVGRLSSTDGGPMRVPSQVQPTCDTWLMEVSVPRKSYRYDPFEKRNYVANCRLTWFMGFEPAKKGIVRLVWYSMQ